MTAKIIHAEQRFRKPKLKLAFKRSIELEDRKPEPWHNIMPDPDAA